jgi:hypothetical protein
LLLLLDAGIEIRDGKMIWDFFSRPEEEETFYVPITADRERGIPASSITWTNMPHPDRHRRGPENVIFKGNY